MEEPIVQQTCREQDAVIHLCLPTRVGTEVNSRRARLHAADYRQAWMCRPLEWDGKPRGRKVPEHLKHDLIVASAKVRCNVKCIVVPQQQAAPCRPDSDPDPVDIELVPSVCREVQERASRS
jgi:hypothetical protein